jgi:hypothetical protein
MTNKTRNLAKGMLPALLLSAALSVPAPAAAGNAKNDRAHAAEKAKDHKKQAKQHAKAAQRNAQQAQKHAQKAQRQARVAAPRRVVAPQRVVVVQPQRVVVPQRRVVVVPAQPVYVAQRGRNNGNRWDNWNRGYSKYSTGVFQLDATSSGRSSGCALVTDHRGQVIPLVGIDPFAFRQGDHVIISGRIQNGTACGTAFRVSSVDRVYDGSNHRNVLFDSRRDGDFFSYRDRGRDDRYDRDDRYGRDRYDDRSDNRRAISIDGRLDDSGDCPVIRGDRGEYYDLIGDLRNFRDGARVRVIGRDGVRSDCGGQAIEVGEIIRR